MSLYGTEWRERIYGLRTLLVDDADPYPDQDPIPSFKGVIIFYVFDNILKIFWNKQYRIVKL
jgi:hypothetical protein